MSEMTERELKRVLRGAPAGADLDRARRELIARAEGDGLIDVAYAGVDSPFGPLLVAGTDRGVVKLGLPNLPFDEVLTELAERISPRVLEAPQRLDDARRELDAYFEGKLHRFDLPIDWRLSRGFRSKALHAVARIPYGETRSYGEIAEEAGNARASRAAGTACGSNPIPLIVPCHRVVQASGAPGNYGGGPEMKLALLTFEGAIEPREPASRSRF
jgi:methylated-DNA-[protein]-cysteine S-methyltransferase